MGKGSGRKRVWSGGAGRTSTTWRDDIELDNGVFSAGVAGFEGDSEEGNWAAFWAWT